MRAINFRITSVSELEPIAESDTSAQLDFVDSVQEASLEDEIAQDVDKLLYAGSDAIDESIENNDTEQVVELLTESDLDVLDNLNLAHSDIIEDLSEDSDTSVLSVVNEETEINSSEIKSGSMEPNLIL